jgi:hypothetical protein
MEFNPARSHNPEDVGYSTVVGRLDHESSNTPDPEFREPVELR